MMLLRDRKHSWISVWEITLFCGILLLSDTCESSVPNETCHLKNVLFVSIKPISTSSYYPTEFVEVDGRKLCFGIQRDKTQRGGCCNDKELNCTSRINQTENSLVMSEEILSMQDVVVMKTPEPTDIGCPPSKFYNKESGSLLNIHKCLNSGVNNIRLSQNSTCGEKLPHDRDFCEGLAETHYKVILENGELRCIKCEPPQLELCPDSTLECINATDTGMEAALKIIKNIPSLLEKMISCSTVAINQNQIRGIINKLPSRNRTNINIGITTSDISVLKNNNNSRTGFSLLVKVSREASEMAVKRNGSFLGLFLIPQMDQGVSGRSFLNNEVVGIEMGAEISNLSETVDIQFRNPNKKGNVASCVSWDGKGEKPHWIKDGCQTKETNDSITCQCSHLTFFGILLSPPPGNISSADLKSLTYITSIGCGLSMFFLVAAIFMHCLIRKSKASQATKLLMNLFVAMFTLNLSFLVNDKIAAIGNFGACVVIAAFLHYTMLATLTWFLMQALHLYCTLWKIPSEIKHYMMKICITGWVTPAVLVIPLLALGKYDYLVISADDGTQAKMCWIPDAVVHQGVNVGYYSIVFIFTFSIFILTVRQISLLKPTQGKTQDKVNSFSILGLLVLLGITWAFAFFSHGPLLIPSYYIFTILNSFQGFLLFIYYYNSSKVVGESSNARVISSTSSSTASNTVISSLYQ